MVSRDCDMPWSIHDGHCSGGCGWRITETHDEASSMFHLRVYLTNTCLACFDLVVTAVCFIVAGYATLGGTRSVAGLAGSLSMEGAASPMPLLIVWISLSCYFGMYRSRRLDSPLADCFVIFKVGLAAWMLSQTATVLLPALQSARTLTLPFVAATCVSWATARSALRLTLREFRRRGYNVKRLLLVASEDLGNRLEAKITERSHYGYRIAARLVCHRTDECSDAGIIERVRKLLRSGGIDDVILALPVQANELSARLVAECESQGINVRIVPDLFPLIQADTQIYDFGGIPLVNARLYPAEFFGYFVFKRAFDLCVSVAGADSIFAALSGSFSPGEDHIARTGVLYPGSRRDEWKKISDNQVPHNERGPFSGS